jgi:serine/threonine protein kinase
MPPRAIGPWVIQSVLGRGGVGTVYRARHRRSGRFAALKVLGPAPVVDGNAARRLAREYEVLRALDHPNVVRVFDTGVDEGWSWLAMELVEGLDLRTWLSPTLDEDGPLIRLDGALERDAPSGSGPSISAPSLSGGPSGSIDRGQPGPDAVRALAQMLDEPDTQPEREFHLPARRHDAGSPCGRLPLPPEASAVLNRPSRVRRLTGAFAQVLSALGYVHRRGLVHRDLKPSNIMVDDHRRARIMDFGLVKPLSGEVTLTGTGKIVGTYRYMSPEQVQGKLVDERSDLYSLGVILYELMAARPPFMARDPAELWREILNERPPPLAAVNPDADPGLARITDRLLEKEPDLRFRSAEDVLAALPWN